MQPQPMTREDVVRTLGEVDEATIADLLSTHATSAQLAAAIARLRDESFGWGADAPQDAEVVTLCEVLQPWWEAEADPEYLGTD